MKTYIGCKIIEAEPDVERDAHGAAIPDGREGYRVIYGGGYRSWSPKGVFEEAYAEVPADEANRILDQTRRYLDDCAGHAEPELQASAPPPMPDSLRATEIECAAGRTAPRVSLDDIEASIKAEFSFSGSAAIDNADRFYGADPSPKYPSLDVLTICLIVLRNGFTIIGKSAPASAENFDENLGSMLAREDAIRQIWPMMGYALRQKLFEASDG